MMIRLFHVSEEPGIALFEPRPVPSPDADVTGDAVWAIDEKHLPNYLLPRDCPRVTYAAGPNTTAEDAAAFAADTKAKRVVVVEGEWRERVQESVLYVYEMPTARFECADAIAGYYISREPVAAASVREVADPLGEIAARGCEVRFVTNLWPLRDRIANSTLEFSMIRMRNAKSRLTQ